MLVRKQFHLLFYAYCHIPFLRKDKETVRGKQLQKQGKIVQRTFRCCFWQDFPDLLLYRIITFPNAVSHLFSVNNLMGMIVPTNQKARKQFIFLAQFRYLVITFRICKLLIRTTFSRSCLFSYLMDIFVTLLQEKSHQKLCHITWCYFIL